MKDPRVRWIGGGGAGIVSMVGDKIALRSTRPSPPGSRIEGALEGVRTVKLLVKVHTCQRQSNEEFVLEGRALNLTRAEREALSGVLSSSSAPAPGAECGESGADES